MHTTLSTKTDWKSTLMGMEKGGIIALGMLNDKQYGAVRTAAWRLNRCKSPKQRMRFNTTRKDGIVIAERTV